MRKLHVIALIAMVISAGFVAVMSPANAGVSPSAGSAVQLSGEYKTIRNANNIGFCLQVNVTDSVSQSGCNGSVEQTWLALRDGTNFYRFVNGSGRGCLSINDNPSSGAFTNIGNCTLSDASGSSVSNAQWIASLGLPNAVSLRTRVGNRDNNLCLNGSGAVTTCGSRPQLWLVNL